MCIISVVLYYIWDYDKEKRINGTHSKYSDLRSRPQSSTWGLYNLFPTQFFVFMRTCHCLEIIAI